MGFMIQQDCKCCRDHLWHCLRCWNRFHNGKKHEDYIQPKHYGQKMFDEEFFKKMVEYGIKFNPVIKEDKNKIYKEGIYH